MHIYDGMISRMESGDVLGHETMGEVVEVCPENEKLKVGDRVVVPFTISCGECFFCRNGFYSGCERSNPDREAAATLRGNSSAGLLAIRTCAAAMRVVRPNIPDSLRPTSAMKVPEHGRGFL